MVYLILCFKNQFYMNVKISQSLNKNSKFTTKFGLIYENTKLHKIKPDMSIEEKHSCPKIGILYFKYGHTGHKSSQSRNKDNSLTKHVINSSLHVIPLIDTANKSTLLKESVYRKLPAVLNLKHSAII